jgi:hypothetical protein
MVDNSRIRADTFQFETTSINGSLSQICWSFAVLKIALQPTRVSHWLPRRVDDFFCRPIGFPTFGCRHKMIVQHIQRQWRKAWYFWRIILARCFSFSLVGVALSLAHHGLGSLHPVHPRTLYTKIWRAAFTPVRLASTLRIHLGGGNATEQFTTVSSCGQLHRRHTVGIPADPRLGMLGREGSASPITARYRMPFAHQNQDLIRVCRAQFHVDNSEALQRSKAQQWH